MQVDKSKSQAAWNDFVSLVKNLVWIMLRPSQAGSWWSTRVADDGITMTGSMTGTRFDDGEEKENETTEREGKEEKERRKRWDKGKDRRKRQSSEFGRDPNMLPGGVQTVAQRNRSSGRWCCVKEERCVEELEKDYVVWSNRRNVGYVVERWVMYLYLRSHDNDYCWLCRYLW